MDKKKKKSYIVLRSIGHALRFILFIMLLYAIFEREWLWVFFAIIMFIITLIPIFLRVYLKIDLPYLFDVFFELSLIFHMDSSLYNFLDFIPEYNKFTHFFSAVVVAFIFLISLFVFNEYHRGIAIDKFKILFDVQVITMAFGVIWEFMEWTSDELFGLNTQPSLDDTMGDLFADTMGGLFIVIIGYFLIKRGILQNFAKNFKKHFNDILD